MAPSSERPRVAHLTTVHHPFDPRIFHKECGTLRDAGFEVHLVAPHTRSETRRGIHITALPQGDGRYRRIILHPRAYRAARVLQADVYHFHDPELIPVAYALKRRTGARVIYDMHEDYRWKGPIEGRLLRVLEHWCFRWVDHVVLSDSFLSDVTRPARVPTTLIANYFKPPEGGEAPSENCRPPLSALRLVYAGVISGERGLFNLIDLAARLKQATPDGQVDLAGVCYRTGDRRRAERRIQREKIGGALQRTGWDRYVPWPRLMARCRRAHVGLVLWNAHPNRTGKIPTKFYEYLHAGLPILCSDFPLWQRFIDEHGCGATVPPGDTEAAFRVLMQWAEAPARYEQLAAAARATAPKYRWKPMGERLARCYRQLLRSAG